MHFMYQCLLVYMVPNACLNVQLREDVQNMNDHPCSPCSPCSQPVHVQGWGGGGWKHWWFYPTPCSASSPCQATQFITNSALTWEVYDAAAVLLFCPTITITLLGILMIESDLPAYSLLTYLMFSPTAVWSYIFQMSSSPACFYPWRGGRHLGTLMIESDSAAQSIRVKQQGMIVHVLFFSTISLFMFKAGGGKNGNVDDWIDSNRHIIFCEAPLNQTYLLFSSMFPITFCKGIIDHLSWSWFSPSCPRLVRW